MQNRSALCLVPSAPSGRILTVAAAAAALTLGLGLGARAAAAQAALEEGEGEEESQPPAPAQPTYSGESTHVGVGLRIRNVRIPVGMLEWFVEDAPGGVSNVGFGGEVSRRKGNFEFVFGVEYEHLTVTPGLWREKGKPILGGSVDDVRDDGFGWVTAEATFMYHTPLMRQLSLRYGGGAGLAIMMGKIRRTDQQCGTTLSSCQEDPVGENKDTPYDTPPVFLVVNAIFGVQIKPTDEIFINVEGGLRTVPFFGTTVGYYF